MSRSNQWLLGGGALLVLLLSALLDPSAQGVGLMGWEFPPLCTWRRLTGWRCPGCGLTRSFVYMGNGQWLEAFRMHWLGPVGWGLVAVQVPFRAWKLFGPNR
ncbi:MAG: DUF2752 domain-containing protein [Myxococcota bacterium]|nr:DUF2752 domain-containing protein [Myxococcota bacterium]